MPIFRCEQCGCIDNTACCNYWGRKYSEKREPGDMRLLCSECDPEIGKWHGIFPKHPADGYCIGADGFLYHPESVAAGQIHHTEMVGTVPGELKPYPEQPETEPPEFGEDECDES